MLKETKHTFGFLHMITNLPEFYPQFGVTEKLEEKMEEIHDNFKHEKYIHGTETGSRLDKKSTNITSLD